MSALLRAVRAGADRRNVRTAPTKKDKPPPVVQEATVPNTYKVYTNSMQEAASCAATEEPPNTLWNLKVHCHDH
jgi:hypothetical protein